MVQREQIVRALVEVPGLEAENIKAVTTDSGRVSVTLAPAGEEGDRRRIAEAARLAANAVEGVEEATVYLTASLEAAEDGAACTAASPQDQRPAPGDAKDPHAPIELPGVRHILAVGAGKGGVGKSTVSMHLAVGLAEAGLSVGLLDADVYGPSIAMMAGIEGEEPAPGSREDSIAPCRAGPLKVISIDNFVPPGAPLMWRGPMVHTAIRQLLGDVDWGELDVLVVDLPPGTGDVPLSLAQSVAVDGAVIVSTPQPVALSDALRAAKMYPQLGISVLGVVENMSWFVCDGCSKEHDIFGRGGARRSAEAAGLAVLGELPLAPALRENVDSARTAENFRDGAPAAAALRAFVANVRQALETRLAEGPPPAPLGVH
jgi:ATP-binding protein involved in chromosome partitioning